MSQPITREELREELRYQLNDRFEHYEKRAANTMAEHERREDERHREMMQGFAEVIENVNAHTDERMNAIEKRLDELAAIAALRETVLNLDHRLARLEATR